MTTFRMTKYAEDDNRLSSVEDAEFLRRKIKPGDVLDFSGIRFVSSAFLDALLSGLTPESLVESFQGVEGAVSDTLADWLDRAGGAGPSAPPKHRPAQPPQPAAPPPAPVFAAPPPDGEKYTPTRLANRLRGQLRRYIESAYPLNDATLIKARRKLLEEAEDGKLLAQEPFVETTPRYRVFNRSYTDLGLDGATAGLLDRLTRTPADHDAAKTLLFPEMYEHQARAFQAFLGKGRDLVVATGTGSGKTECFLVPLLARLHGEAKERPRSFAKRSVRGLILYPMNALVNDQLARLRLLLGSQAVMNELRSLGGRHPVFGMYTSRTPYPGPRTASKDQQSVEELLMKYLATDPALTAELKQLGRWPAKDLVSFLAKEQAEKATYKSGKKKGKEYTKHNWSARLATGNDDRELLTRHEMVRDPETGQGAAPDVLVTNYSMLEYMLMRPFERPVFEETRAWLDEPGSRFLLVLDEAHMYRGAKGAEVAFLLRRLFARLGINDRPEKLSVICTSASLGGTGDAREVARRFAADLTGKAPSGFEVVFGEREKPSPVGPGDAALAEVLSGVSLEALQGDAAAGALAGTVAPVLRHLGDEGAAPEPAEVPSRLLAALRDRPWLNQVLASTSERAIPLAALADIVFPGSPSRRKATEVLLSLGTLARQNPTDASLLPTRIHMIFRGLAGIYACIDPRCAHRQERPGEEAPLGKLFATPRTLCDCGARVFELASCRNCGGAYLLAQVPRGQVGSARFLWGEADGDLETIQILPTRPRNEEGVFEAAIQLTTGHVVAPGRAGEPGLRVRSIWLPRDRETGERVGELARCPLCQPPGLPLYAQRRANITDLRTRGEQPFTALVEAQFAEQPAQKQRPDLPNQGRKVLVFSDGRQRAARLAPALEVSHSRDAFRQVLLLAARELEKMGRTPRVSLLFPAVLRVCIERHIDLFPQADETHFHNALLLASHLPLHSVVERSVQGSLQATLTYAKDLFTELTDRWFSLPAMGLANVEEEPTLSYLFNDFPDVGLGPDEVRILFRTWIRAQLERRCFLPPGASIGQLGEQWERPEGIRLDAKHDLIPIRFGEWLGAVIGEPNVAKVAAWLTSLARRSGFLRLENDAHYLQPAELVLRPRVEERWWRCQSCSRLELFVLRERCPDCLGKMAPADDALDLDARHGFYRDQVHRALRGDSLEPFGLTTAEHSAQLSGLNDDEAFSTTEKYELRFQDVKVEGQPPIDVLSCTTTMEVGIDIGALTGVALRNVPPHVANYQQRAGRAGRRGRTIASVVTYAHGGSHDAWYYEHPERMISGELRAPIVYIQNPKVLERHVHAFLVQSFFHETVPAAGRSYQLFASLGTVRDFLSPAEPCSLDRFVAWLKEHRDGLLAALLAWVPSYSHGLDRPIDTKALAEGAIEGLVARLSSELPVALHRDATGLDEAQRAGLEMLLDEQLLQTLIDRAILPRYAFPTDTVSFWVPERRRPGTKAYKKTFDYSPQRDLSIALSEYAPGRTLTIDKIRFESAALYSPYPPGVREVLSHAQAYTSCKACGYLTLKARAHPGAACPVCGGGQLSTLDFIRPEGFAPDVNKERVIDRGGSIRYAGMSTPAKIEVESVAAWDEVRFAGRLSLLARPQTLVVVNKGVGDRGFHVCPACGSAEPVFGTGFTTPRLVGKDNRAKVHAHPTEEGGQCTGSVQGPFYLGHRFPTDVLLLRLQLAAPVRCAVDPRRSGRAGRMALTTFVEALCLAASRTLQIDEGELAGNWNPVPGDVMREADLYLYDLLPGGAGHTHQVKKHLDSILVEARRLLEGCDCAQSCQRCLRHYDNQLVHGSLDRKLGLSLLDYVRDGILPAVSPAEALAASQPLTELLALKGVRFEHGFGAGAPVPLRVTVDGGVKWVEIHHPLIDPEEQDSTVLDAAQATLTPVVPIDTHTLMYDLPLSLERLGLKEG